MTGPFEGPSLGDAYVSVHGNIEPFYRDVVEGVEEATTSAEAEKVLDGVGKHFGERISSSTSKEVKKHGKDITDAVEKATEGRSVRFRGRFNFLSRLIDRRRAARDIVTNLEEDIASVVRSRGSGGGFSQVGLALRDAIGAGFNISGRSPLIPFLAPLIGVIVALVAGALQAINSLVALLAMLPALLSAIALQVGILFLAFKGLGTAITAAFAAKNAKELDEALKGLQPRAQEFVRALLPIKDIFSWLQRAAQQNFFLNFGTGPVKGLLAFLDSEAFKGGFMQLAAELGAFFGQLAAFFSNTSFREFVEDLFPATIRFLRLFGPSFITFLTGLVRLADASLPFLNQIGVMVGNMLEIFGQFLMDTARDGTLQAWLDSMTTTFASVLELFAKLVKFVEVFLAQLDKAGGDKIIDEFANAFEQLTFLLASPVGLEFMKGLISFSVLAIDSFTGLLEILILIVAGIQWLADTGLPDAIEGLGILVGKIGEFFSRLFETVGQAIQNFLEWVGQGILDGVHAIGKWFSDLWTDITDGISAFFNLLKETVTGLPAKIVAWAKGLATSLFDTGKHIIGGLIDGIKEMLPDLSGLFRWITDNLPDWKGPMEKDKQLLVPTGKAIMGGLGAGLKAGARDIKSMLGDFTTNMDAHGQANHFTFGSNSIQVRFSGVVPTQQQAFDTGLAVGSGITNQLAVRNTQLAVRSL